MNNELNDGISVDNDILKDFPNVELNNENNYINFNEDDFNIFKSFCMLNSIENLQNLAQTSTQTQNHKQGDKLSVSQDLPDENLENFLQLTTSSIESFFLQTNASTETNTNEGFLSNFVIPTASQSTKLATKSIRTCYQNGKISHLITDNERETSQLPDANTRQLEDISSNTINISTTADSPLTNVTPTNDHISNGAEITDQVAKQIIPNQIILPSTSTDASRAEAYTNHQSKTKECNSNTFQIQKHFKPYPVIQYDDEIRFCCSYCNKEFGEVKDFEKHLRDQHLEERYTFVCESCGKGYIKKNFLDEHREAFHQSKNNEEYTCEICDSKFTRKSNLVMHIRSHSRSQTHQCPYCGKIFSRKDNLTQHEYIHTNRKAFLCEKCGKSFINLPYFNVHKKKCNNLITKVYGTCKNCNKVFISSGGFKNHINICKTRTLHK